MTPAPIDLDQLRGALGRMKRGQLLIIANRAVEIVPPSKLDALLGDLLSPSRFAQTAEGSPARSLLNEVRDFHSASIAGKYYDSFDVDSKNFMQKSEGTEAFIADFDRLMGRCIRASAKGPRNATREAFALLIEILRRIDDSPDDVVFFADEAGSWQVPVDWRSAVPAYFRCLADDLPPEEFAREVDRTVTDFVDHERPHHLGAARRVANTEQKKALQRLPARKARR
jgi:hypothetical protein